MNLNHDLCYQAVKKRNSKYDGVFFTGVLTTGIFCRPSCAARTPKSENVRFFDSVEDALKAGLRPCKLCKPDQLSK